MSCPLSVRPPENGSGDAACPADQPISGLRERYLHLQSRRNKGSAARQKR